MPASLDIIGCHLSVKPDISKEPECRILVVPFVGMLLGVTPKSGFRHKADLDGNEQTSAANVSFEGTRQI